VRKGEKGILIGSVVVVGLVIAVRFMMGHFDASDDKGIPFYSTASPELRMAAMKIYKQENCKNCHTLWTVRDMMRKVPAPALDGIGSLHDEQWFYEYFSAPDPQQIVPSRLKEEFRMPSFAFLSEQERRTLAQYMASLKVEDWYLPAVKKDEYEKLTGKVFNQ